MGFITDLISSVLDDVPMTTDERQPYVDHVLSDLLSYRVYDPKENLYYNEGTCGFLLEIPPVIGTDTFRTLHTAINSYCPTDGTVQFLSWASPNMGPSLYGWANQRVVQTPLLNKMVDRRIDHFNSLRFGNEGVIKCVPHRRRVMIAGWVDGDPNPSILKSLKEFRRNLVLSLGGDQQCVNMLPSSFLDVLSEVLHSRSGASVEPMPYDEEVPINYQVPGAGLAVGRDGISFLNKPELSVSSATVRSVPAEWSAAMGMMFNGSPDHPEDSPYGPVLISLVARARSSQAALSEMVTKRAKVEHLKSTNFGRYVSDLGERDREFETLHSELERGERMFETVMTVSAFGSGDVEESTAALSEMKKIMSFCNVSLEQDSFLQLPIFLAGLPFMVSGPLLADMRKASRVKKRKAAAVTALAPIHGEWSGFQRHRGLMLVGRQGQLFDWDNFQSTGNYNVSVVGKSGAGKSVFMQELVTSIYSCGGKVLVIDDGYSFKNTSEILGGAWLGIGQSDKFKLNPFSMLSAKAMKDGDYQAEVLSLITRVLATMANLGEQREGRVGNIEEEHITAACAEVWRNKGTDGCVTDVVELLAVAAKEERRLSDVVTKLKRYARGGIFGAMFDGPANVSIESDFTVFELSELKSQRELQDVVLQIIMFLGTELMFKTDRSQPVAILIDEAWDMLGGEGTANFLEGVVRRARKYSGALITGTQSLNDYYDNKAALVCYENSDWAILLPQKAESVDALVSDGKLSIPEGISHSIKSLVSVKGQFSELGIRGPEGWVFGRLMLDPYSLAIFSTTGETVERLRQLREMRGLDMGEALEVMVEEGVTR